MVVLVSQHVMLEKVVRSEDVALGLSLSAGQQESRECLRSQVPGRPERDADRSARKWWDGEG